MGECIIETKVVCNVPLSYQYLLKYGEKSMNRTLPSIDGTTLHNVTNGLKFYSHQ